MASFSYIKKQYIEKNTDNGYPMGVTPRYIGKLFQKHILSNYDEKIMKQCYYYLYLNYDMLLALQTVNSDTKSVKYMEYSLKKLRRYGILVLYHMDSEHSGCYTLSEGARKYMGKYLNLSYFCKANEAPEKLQPYNVLSRLSLNQFYLSMLFCYEKQIRHKSYQAKKLMECHFDVVSPLSRNNINLFAKSVRKVQIPGYYEQLIKKLRLDIRANHYSCYSTLSFLFICEDYNHMDEIVSSLTPHLLEALKLYFLIDSDCRIGNNPLENMHRCSLENNRIRIRNCALNITEKTNER